LSAEAPPIFIGETPRSGSHVLAHLIGRHTRYHAIPEEAVFHANKGGLIGYIEGTLTREQLVESLRSHWWRRPMSWDPGSFFGLHRLVTQEDFDAALAAFESIDDPVDASRALVRNMLDPLAARAGKPGWVEHTPNNIGACVELARIFPEARFITTVRDGRDRACSLVQLPWGPDSVEEAIRAWAWKLRSDDAQARRLPPGRVFVLQLEDLVLVDREGTYGRLLEFLELDDEPAVRSFFDEDVTPRRAHIGRWRSELPADERERISALYEEVLADLAAAGVSGAPADHDISISYPREQSEPPNPYDTWASGTYSPLDERATSRET
jgi:hypothetical protein